MSLQVFISHSSADRDVAQKVCEMIEARGLKCWIAPRNITPGREYAAEIVDAINDCGALVLVLTENANDSKFVAKEVERAVDRGRPVIPLRVREVKPGKSLELFISSSHWIDAFTSPMDAKMDQLEAALRPLCDMPAAPARPAPRPVPAKKGESSRGPVIGAAVGAAVLVAGGAWWMLAGKDPAPAAGPVSAATQTASAPASAASSSAAPASAPPPASAVAPAPAPASSAPTPLVAPPAAGEAELIAELGTLEGYDRLRALKELAPRLPPALSEGGMVAMADKTQEATRRQAIDLLANQLQQPMSVAGVEALARPMQGFDRTWVFQRLARQDVLPRELSVDDAARLLQGLNETPRRDAIEALAPALAAGVDTRGLATVANPLMGFDRARVFASLAKNGKIAGDLRGTAVAEAIREAESAPRREMVETLAPLLAAGQGFADLAALAGPLRAFDRNRVLAMVSRQGKIAAGLSVADAETLMRGETEAPRREILETLAPFLASPLSAADVAALYGPLVEYDRIKAIRILVTAGLVGPVSQADAQSFAGGFDDGQRRELGKVLAPVMQ